MENENEIHEEGEEITQEEEREICREKVTEQKKEKIVEKVDLEEKYRLPKGLTTRVENKSMTSNMSTERVTMSKKKSETESEVMMLTSKKTKTKGDKEDRRRETKEMNASIARKEEDLTTEENRIMKKKVEDMTSEEMDYLIENATVGERLLAAKYLLKKREMKQPFRA